MRTNASARLRPRPFPGSVRLTHLTDDGEQVPVETWVSAQEVIVNIWPVEPLVAGGTYRVDVPAGGVVDFNGNPVEEPFSMTFHTAD